MAIKVGINGFGRIGRMVFRAVAKDFKDIEVVAINDLLDPEYLAYMLKYDSVHGRFNGDISVDGNNLIVNGKKIRLTAEHDPANLKWNEVGADIVIECTGFFLTKETCQKHIDAGAKKVVQSAPSKDDTPMFVYGVNHDKYAGEAIVSAASCTTNCLAPVAKVLNDNWGIKRGLMTTVHAATATQKTVDGPSMQGLARRPRHPGKHHPVLHRRRQGRRRGAARTEQEADRHGVPRSDLRRVGGRSDRRAEQGRQLRRHLRGHEGGFAKAATSEGVLGYTDEKVVSTDFRGNGCSSIFDAEAGIALDDTFVKVVSWYDNEYGYTCNMLRFVQHVAK